MTDFWDNLLPLALAWLAAFFMYGMGKLILSDMEKTQVRYEQCIAADKQWIEGHCVK